MKNDVSEIIKKIKIPSPDSHKGQNGRLLIIGGSHLFHAASLWSLVVASRIVDLVHYSSVEENNAIVQELKTEFRNGMVILRRDIEPYIQEDDVILIGPGMVRTEGKQDERVQIKDQSLEEILQIEDEGVQTWALTNYLLQQYPNKQWVIDAGALQMLELKNIPPHAILTPHHQEFELLMMKDKQLRMNDKNQTSPRDQVEQLAKAYNCIVLLKGHKDIVSNGIETNHIEGGNAGMTKGGTGDVLAGLIAALACTNDPMTATIVGSYINKCAGDDLYASVGPFFNATDLADQIPKTMKRLILPDAF